MIVGIPRCGFCPPRAKFITAYVNSGTGTGRTLAQAVAHGQALIASVNIDTELGWGEAWEFPTNYEITGFIVKTTAPSSIITWGRAENKYRTDIPPETNRTITQSRSATPMLGSVCYNSYNPNGGIFPTSCQSLIVKCDGRFEGDVIIPGVSHNGQGIVYMSPLDIASVRTLEPQCQCAP